MNQLRMPMLDNKEFEYFMVDYAKIVLNKDAQIYGHNGETQNGIDIVIYNKNRVITEAIQCKNYIIDKKVKKSFIVDCIQKADTFIPNIRKLYIAFAFENTTKLINICNEINEIRSQQGKFVVELIFWDEISKNICYQPELINKYYKPFVDILSNPFRNKPYSEKEISLDYEWKMFEGFNKIVYECKVINFIESSPFEGITTDIIDKIEDFYFQTEEYLRLYFFWCKSEVYDCIYYIHFYVNHLNFLYACHMELNEAGTIYRMIKRPYSNPSYDEEFYDSIKEIQTALSKYICRLCEYVNIIRNIKTDN